MDLLVMENLLFGRNITRLYDLKGSSRSRYNADSSNNKVLLDQNLIEAMPTSPIFVGNKAKRLLERAVWNDTSFLAVSYAHNESYLFHACIVFNISHRWQIMPSLCQYVENHLLFYGQRNQTAMCLVTEHLLLSRMHKHRTWWMLFPLCSF